MATDGPAPDLDLIDWGAVEDAPRLARRDRAFVGTFVAFLAGATAYTVGGGPSSPVFGFWDPLLVDWMFYAALLVFGVYVVWPLARPGSLLRRSWSSLRADRAALASFGWLAVFVLVGTAEPLIVRSIPFNPLNQPPAGFAIYTGYVGSCVGEVTGELCHGTLAHPFGTDGNGRDLLLLTVAGMRTALEMTLITAVIIVPIGVGVGTVAGYVGGRVDDGLMRYVDAQQTLPALFIYIALAVVYGPSLTLMVVVFGLLYWGDIARLVRSEVLQVTQAEFVDAARMAGVSQWQVIRHHVIPNAAPTVLSITALKLPLLVIIEATLSYLEFADPRVVSWGNVVSVNVLWSQDPTLYWWVSLFPIGALVLTTLAISLFGNALQDAIDPRHLGGGHG
jgi:peptide/nickel transport system permease protein